MKDGQQEAVKVCGGTDFFKQIGPVTDKTEDSSIDEIAMYDTIDDD